MMQKQHKLFITLLFVSSHLLSAPLNAESSNDILVFVNTANSVGNLSVAEVKQIFLKEKTKWSTGNNIVCINPLQNAAVRDQFRRIVLEMTSGEEDAYWQDKKIRDNLSTPISFVNTPRAVFKLRDSISYGFRKDVPSSVAKVVLVIPAR